MLANSSDSKRHAGRINVSILGAGAVGLGLAATLHQASASVRLITRPENPQPKLSSQGLRRHGLFGTAHAPPTAIPVESSLESLQRHPTDFVMICTKTTAIPTVTQQLAEIWPRLKTKPIIVLCQNGWGSAQIVAEHLPASHVFSSRVITGFHKTGPSSVEITAHAQPIRIGSLFQQDPSVLGPLCEALSQGGIPAEISASIDRDLWAKMLYNCALNPLGALMRVPYGEVVRRPHSRELLESVIREIFEVLKTTPYDTYWDNANDYLDVFYRELLPPTEDHDSSMLQDLRAGRPTEIDSLCGAVAELASQHGLGAPVNAALTQCVHACAKF
jgi:2-dehydropantoate 2-reductase